MRRAGQQAANHQSLTAPSSSHEFWLSASLLTEGSPLAQPNPIHLPYPPRGELGGCFPNLSPGCMPPAPAGPRGLPHRWLRGPPNSPGSRRGPVCPAGGRTQVRTGSSSAATQPCQPHGQQGAGLPTSGPGTAAKDLCKNRQNVVYNGTFALQQGLSCRRGPPGFFPHNSCWVSPFPTALPPPRSGNDLHLHPRRRRPVRGAQAGRGGRAAPLHLGLARPGRQRGQRGSATRRPHGTVPAPTFSPGLPLSPLGPCKGKGGG